MTTIDTQTGLNAKTPAATSDVDLPATRPEASVEPTAEQLRYAGLLEKGMRVGLACLLFTFSLYIFGVMEPCIPLAKIQECWSSPERYHEEAGIAAGWGWVAMLGRGDFANFVGIVILGGVTAFCYLAILPAMLKRRDLVYATLAILQVAVLALAASGLCAVGH